MPGKGHGVEAERFEACMVRICNGEKDALKEIYDEYMKYIYSIIFNVVRNSADAEDITSDFFIKLWSNSDKYKAGNGHKGFLATMARNMAIDHLRKYKKEVLISDFEADYSEDDSSGRQEKSRDGHDMSGDLINEGNSSESHIENEVIGDISLKQALEKLKPREREVVNMKIMGDMTFKEISAATKTPMGTVTWLYREAIEKLRRCGYE